MEEGAVVIVSVGIGLELALHKNHTPDCCYKVFWGQGDIHMYCLLRSVMGKISLYAT